VLFYPEYSFAGGDSDIERAALQPLIIFICYVFDDCIVLLFEFFTGVNGQEPIQQMRS